MVKWYPMLTTFVMSFCLYVREPIKHIKSKIFNLLIDVLHQNILLVYRTLKKPRATVKTSN